MLTSRKRRRPNVREVVKGRNSFDEVCYFEWTSPKVLGRQVSGEGGAIKEMTRGGGSDEAIRAKVVVGFADAELVVFESCAEAGSKLRQRSSDPAR